MTSEEKRKRKEFKRVLAILNSLYKNKKVILLSWRLDRDIESFSKDDHLMEYKPTGDKTLTLHFFDKKKAGWK